MWQIKTFKTREAMLLWIARNESRMQWNQIYINNGYAVEYRKLRMINV